MAIVIHARRWSGNENKYYTLPFLVVVVAVVCAYGIWTMDTTTTNNYANGAARIVY